MPFNVHPIFFFVYLIWILVLVVGGFVVAGWSFRKGWDAAGEGRPGASWNHRAGATGRNTLLAPDVRARGLWPVRFANPPANICSEIVYTLPSTLTVEDHGPGSERILAGTGSGQASGAVWR
jgi:hypothetical protein